MLGNGLGKILEELQTIHELILHFSDKNNLKEKGDLLLYGNSIPQFSLKRKFIFFVKPSE